MFSAKFGITVLKRVRCAAQFVIGLNKFPNQILLNNKGCEFVCWHSTNTFNQIFNYGFLLFVMMRVYFLRHLWQKHESFFKVKSFPFQLHSSCQSCCQRVGRTCTCPSIYGSKSHRRANGDCSRDNLYGRHSLKGVS